jgi:hypothetical protein
MKGFIDRIEPVGKQRSYSVQNTLDLNRLLLPYLLRKFASLEEAQGGNNQSLYIQLLAGETGFTDVVRGIIGKKGTQILITAAGSIRKVFEWTNAKTQCAAVLKLPDGTPMTAERVPDRTPCWICSLPMTERDKNVQPGDRENNEPATGLQCEHKLAVGLALLFTGLYDTNLARAIRSVKYIEKLQDEYAWSHELCNQVKSETPYVQDTSPGDTIVLAPNVLNINSDLETIWTTDYRQYIPRHAEFQRRATEDLGLTKETWKTRARTGIQTGLDPIIKTVNEQLGVTKSVVYAHFRRNVLLRAKLAYDVVPDRPQQIRPSVAGRNRIRTEVRNRNVRRRIGGYDTRRNRKGLRTTRRMRGGVNDVGREFQGLIDDTVGYVRMLVSLHIEDVLRPVEELNPYFYIAGLYGDKFVTKTFDIATEALDRALWQTDYSGVGDDELESTIDASIDWQVSVGVQKVYDFNLSQFDDTELEATVDGFEAAAPPAAPTAPTAAPQPSIVQRLFAPLLKRQKEEAPAQSPAKAPPPPTDEAVKTGPKKPRADDDEDGDAVLSESSDGTSGFTKPPSTKGGPAAAVGTMSQQPPVWGSFSSQGGGGFGPKPDWLSSF